MGIRHLDDGRFVIVSLTNISEIIHQNIWFSGSADISVVASKGKYLVIFLIHK